MNSGFQSNARPSGYSAGPQAPIAGFRLCLGCLAVCLALSSPPAMAQTISTLAGTGSAGFSGDAGLPANAQLNLPSSVFGDLLGNIYIADTGNHRIRTMGPALNPISTHAGTGVPGFADGAAAAAQFNTPTGLFATPAGSLYVADSGNHAIRLITPAGTVSTVAGDGTPGFSGDGGVATAAQLNAPSGVFVNGAGVMYIADTGNNRIRRVIGTTITTIAGDSTSGFSGDGGPASMAQLDGPSSVFVDTAGTVFIADTNNHRVRTISAADSTITTFAGMSPGGFSGDGDIPTNAQFAFLETVFGDTVGNIYVTDTFNHRVRRINTVGNVTTLAGDGIFGFGGNGGAANLARLGSPTGVFVDTAQTIFIADRDNHRVRRIVPDNVFGLAGMTTVGPAREVQIFRVAFTGDGNTAIKSITLTVSDLGTPTGLTNTDFVEFKLYESSDATLSGDDSKIGSLDSASVVIGTPFVIPVESTIVPTLAATRHYIVSAVVDSQAVESHAFKVGFVIGDLSTTTGGRVSRLTASDANRVTIDVVATELLFTTQPGGSVSGNPLLAQPSLTAFDDLGFVDSDFTDLITLTTAAAGTLLFNTTTAVAGVAEFTNVTYVAVIDDELFTITADDAVGGAEGDLAAVVSNSVASNKFNDPPVVSLISFTLLEDESFVNPIADFVSDPDDSVFTITSLSSHFQVTLVDDDLVLEPEPDWFGRDTITVIATDPFGAQGSNQMIIDVTSVNDPPTLSPITALVFDEDDTLEIDLQAQVDDPDDGFGELTFTLTPLAGLGISFDQGTGSLQMWAPSDSSGEFSLIVNVRDNSLISQTDTVLITVSAVNDIPSFAVPDTSMFQASKLSVNLAVFANDVEDDILTWQATGTPNTKLTIDPSGVVTIEPDIAFSGFDTLSFTAFDLDGASTTDTVVVEVVAVNQPPTLATIADLALIAGDTLEIDLSPLVADLDDLVETLVWTVSEPNQGEATVDEGLLILTTQEGLVYEETLEIEVTDPSGESASASLLVSVAPWPGIITPIQDILFELGKKGEIPLDQQVLEELDPASITWSATRTGNFAVVISPDTRIVSIVPDEGWKGTGEIFFEAKDEMDRVDRDTIFVSVENPKPRVDFLDSFKLKQGGTAQFRLDDYVLDDEPVASLQWTAQPDSGVRTLIDTVNRFLSVTADLGFEGPSEVSLQATDAQGDAGTGTFVVDVFVDVVDASGNGLPQLPDTSLAPGNTAPVVNLPSQLEFPSGGFQELRLDLHVSDDTPANFISWDAEPDSGVTVSVNQTSRIATVRAAEGFEGDSRVIFRAEDALGDFDSGSVIVRVLPPLPAPEPGDFDGSGRIGLEDFFLLADHIGLTVVHLDWDPIFDLDGDGGVTFDDFFIFADFFAEAQAAN